MKKSLAIAVLLINIAEKLFVNVESDKTDGFVSDIIDDTYVSVFLLRVIRGIRNYYRCLNPLSVESNLYTKFRIVVICSNCRSIEST